MIATFYILKAMHVVIRLCNAYCQEYMDASLIYSWYYESQAQTLRQMLILYTNYSNLPHAQCILDASLDNIDHAVPGKGINLLNHSRSFHGTR